MQTGGFLSLTDISISAPPADQSDKILLQIVPCWNDMQR